MRRAAQTCDRGKDLLRWISTTAVLGLGVSGSPAAGAQPKDPEPEAPSEPPRDATAEATEPSAQQADRPERDAERNEFPRSASRPGTPLRSYDKHQRAPKVPADDARGLTQKPGWESEDYVLLPMRAVLFPAKLLVDIVFTPIEVMLTGIDRYKLIPRVIDFFYFDEDHTAGFYPTVASETGYGLSYGAKVFNKDVAGHAEELSFEGKFGGRYFQAYEAVFDGDRVGGSRFWLETRTRYEKQPGILFFGYGGEEESTGGSGLGPREANVGTRFQQERFLGVARIGGTLGERGGDLTQVGLFGVYNHRRFAGEQRDFPEPSIEQIYDTSRIRGFDEGVNSIELGLTVVHDTRDHELASSGSYLEVLGGAVLPADGYRYWHFGGELTGFIDLYRETRVLALRAALEGVAGHEDEIPFVELPRLGGVHDLRGYLTDRFRDKLSAVGPFGPTPFDPRTWREAYPYWPFYELDAVDAFWGAKLFMRFDQEILTEIVKRGKLSDTDAAKYLVSTLLARRETVGRVYLEALSPLDDFHFEQLSGQARLCAVDLGQVYRLARSGVVQLLDADDDVRSEHTVHKDGRVCIPVDGDGYRVERLRVVRGRDIKPVMQVHFRLDGKPRVLGLIRKEH